MELEIVAVISSAVVAVVAVLTLLYTSFKGWVEISERLAKVEKGLEDIKEGLRREIDDLKERLTKVEDLMGALRAEVASVAASIGRTGNPNGRREELLNKLKDETLTRSEAEELDEMLREELEEAKKRGDTGTALAIALLLGFIKPLIS